MGKKDTITVTPSPARLSPLDVQQKEFRVSRFGGYKMRDVDEFLDQITDTLTALTGEVERLRAGGAGPVVGSPDLDDVARQADEIIARARAEASRITAEARAAGSVSTVGGAPDRSAVTAFIDRERSFLQSLAGLVQEHAETMKGMAKSARQASPAPARAERASASAPAQTASRSAQAGPASDTGADGTAAGSTRESMAGSTPTTAPSGDAPTRVPESETTVRIEEPEPAVASRVQGEAQGEGDGDRSLRELFWGED